MATDNSITHWTSWRKSWLINEVRSGSLTKDQALSAYGISAEEFHAWERDFDAHGIPGLRSTRYQIYRGRLPGQRPRGRPRGKAIAAAIAAFALASPVAAKAQSIAAENLCRDPEVAAT